jgi:oligopeptide/dipeptide ABC transporter ATP-binding protein
MLNSPQQNGVAPLLEVEGLTIDFPTREGHVCVVRDMSFRVVAGECLAIVGESGSGKSMTARSILKLVPPPGRIVAGSIRVGGSDVLKLPPGRLRRLRGADVSMIFQDPTSTLNPLITVGRQLTDAIRTHTGVSRGAARQRALEVLDEVGVPGAGDRLRTYPFELSGGLRQRVSIALALACRPRLVIADEPTTNLDVSVQAQILDLLLGLKDESDFGIVFISHDIGVVANIADRVMVMYSGQAVEKGSIVDTLEDPLHPYTRALLECAPTLAESARDRMLCSIKGIAPSFAESAPGCSFAPRCPERIDGVCDQQDPPWVQTERGRTAACHQLSECVQRDVREEGLRPCVK